MYSIHIKGEFTTGTTVSSEQEAKNIVVELLKKQLDQIQCLGPSGVFDFEIKEITAEKL